MQTGADIQIFDRLLQSANLARQDIEFIDLASTGQKLLQTVIYANPSVVVPLGGECLEALTGSKDDLMKLAGKPFSLVKDTNTPLTVIPTVSLAYLTRDIGYLPRAQRHWEDIARIANGGTIERPKTPTKYVYVQDIEHARKLFARMAKCEYIVFDLETTGFNFQEDRILCWAFSWKPYTAVLLPMVGFNEQEIWGAEELVEIRQQLQNLFKNPSISWVAHNISFDEKFLINQGIHIEGPIHDTMLLSVLIDENAKDLQGLKPLADLYTDLGDYSAPLDECVKELKIEAQKLRAQQKQQLNKALKTITKTFDKTIDPAERKKLRVEIAQIEYELDELTETPVDISYAQIPTTLLWQYAATDADATIRIFFLFLERLRQESDMLVKPFGRSMVKLYNKLVMPLRKVLNDMEFLGAQLDLEYLKDLDVEYADKTVQSLQELLDLPEIKNVEKRLTRSASTKIAERYDKLTKPPLPRDAYIAKYTKPVSFNMNSPAHLCTFIYDVLKVKPFKFTPAGKPSTDKEVLERLTENNTHDAIAKLQENRKITKLHKTYVKGMQKRADKNGRVHTNFNQHGTVTGRLSCLHGDTSIVTDKGVMPIRRAPKRCRILTQYGFKPATMFCAGKSKLCKMTVAGRDILVTPEHKFYTPSGDFKTVAKLRPGDHICGTIKYSNSPKTGVLTLSEKREAFQLGLKSSHTTTIPRSVLEHPQEEYVCWFLLSLFTSCNKSDQINFCSASETLVDQIAMLFDRLSIRTAKRYVPYSQIGHKQGLWELTIIGELSAQRFREKVIALKISDEPVVSTQLLINGSVDDQYQVKIDAIEEMRGEYDVFDFTVDDVHQYVVHGLICHNSSNPNLQNIPRANKDIKRAFVTQEGWSIVQMDYSQAEFRMWAQLSQDRAMINDIAAGLDIHRVTASEFWGIPEEQVTKDQRSAAKFVVFGLMYGRGAESVAKQVKIRKEEAEAIIKNFFDKYPVAARWLHQTQQFAKTHRYVWNHFGRVRRLPHAQSFDREKVADAMRRAVNAPIQGSAADMTGIGLIRIWKQLKQRGLQARLILTVHDSIVLECPDDELLEVTKLCHMCMTSQIEDLNVPMAVEIEVGKNWADLEEWSINELDECYNKYRATGTVKTPGGDNE